MNPYRLTSLAAIFFLGGCSYTQTAVVPDLRPGSGGIGAHTAVAPMMGGEWLGDSRNELATRVSLVRADEEATCFDLLTPLPGHGSGAAPGQSVPVELHVDVDDVERGVARTSLEECSQSRLCLPRDSPLLPYALEPAGETHALGQRVCFDGLPHATRSLAVGRRGLFAWKFRFELG